VTRDDRDKSQAPSRVITIRPTKAGVWGIHGHVLWIETHRGSSDGSTDVPIEAALGLAILVAADIVLLWLSGRYAVVPRDLIRVIGGAFAVFVAIWVVFFVVAAAIVSLVIEVLTSLDSKRAPHLKPSAQLSAALISVGLGAVIGTSAVIGGPADLVAVVVLLIAAFRVGRGGRPGGRFTGLRRLGATALVISAVTAGFVGLWLLNHA
jgi:hypothetical protein